MLEESLIYLNEKYTIDNFSSEQTTRQLMYRGSLKRDVNRKFSVFNTRILFTPNDDAILIKQSIKSKRTNYFRVELDCDNFVYNRITDLKEIVKL